MAVQLAGRCQGGGAQCDGWAECLDIEGLWPGHNIEREHMCWLVYQLHAWLLHGTSTTIM